MRVFSKRVRKQQNFSFQNGLSGLVALNTYCDGHKFEKVSF